METSDRPLSVHVRAAALLYKKLKLSGLFEDKENQTSARKLRTADLSSIRDLEKYLRVVGSVIPNHPSYRRRRDDADIKELEGRVSEIRSIVKHLSGSSPAKFVEKPKADKQSHNSYLKTYLTETNQNGVSKDDSNSKQRGPVQEARVRAKIAALASRNALNRSKKQTTGANASSVMSDTQMHAQFSLNEIMTEELGNSSRAGSREGPILATPTSEMISAASTPGMTNISQFLFSSNSKSTVNTSTAWGEQASVQKPTRKTAKQESPSVQSVRKNAQSVQKSDGEKVIQEVDFMSVRQEMMHLDKKFTNYWLRTSEGCSAMTDLIQSVKDDSQQVHVALANELDQVSNRSLSGSSKVEQVEHKLEGLEMKFDAMNNVLSSNLKNLCTIAMSKDEEKSQSKPPKVEDEQESASKEALCKDSVEIREVEDSKTNEMYDKLAQSVEEKIEKLDSKFSSAVEEWGKKNENENQAESKILETKIDKVQSDVDSCLEKAGLGASHEQLCQLAQSVDEKVGSLEARLGSHLSRTIESLENFKEHSFGSQLNARLVELKKEILTEISSASKAEVTGEQFLHLTQSVEEKVENLEVRFMNEMQQEKRLVEKKEQILESELDTRFSEWKKDIVKSTVKNEQLLSLRQTVDKDVKNCNTAIKNVEQSLSQKLVETIEESKASVTKSLDEKWMTLKQELAGSTTSTEDEYLDIMHKMSEKIKQLDSKFQEVILTSESGFEWIQEKQSKFEQKLQGDLQTKLEEIDSKISKMQSKEAVTKCVEDALRPLDTRVGSAVERVDAFEAARALMEEKVDALQTNYNEMSSVLQEQAKSKSSDEELIKIQNAQRDLYCGLYCTSKVLKEKILSLESKLEELKKNGSTAQNYPEQEGVIAGQKTLNQLVDDFEKLQKQTAGLADSVSASNQEMDSKLLSSVSGLKQSIEMQSQNLKKDLQEEISKFQIHERENMKELQMSQLDQIKRHFDKRLLDHKKVFDQKLKAIADSNEDTSSTPLKRSASKTPKNKTPAKSPKRRNSNENETKRLIEMVVKQLETQAERLTALEGKQQQGIIGGDAALNGEVPSHLSNEAFLTKAVDKALSQSKDSKIQTSELTKLLKQHVGVVEGKMGLFEQSIQMLTQSIAVAHAKLAQQDTFVAGEGKVSSRPNSKAVFNVVPVKKSPSASRKPVGTPKKYKSSSSIQPRVTHNARAAPQRTRSAAFY